MAFTRIVDILNTEEARLNALLSATPAPSNYQAYMIRKTLSSIGLLKQQTGETDADYKLRCNVECQRAVPGNWSTSFFSQLDAAVAADTGEGSQGGRGRSD